MIKGMHYFAVAIFITGISMLPNVWGTTASLFFSTSAGLVLGLGIGYFCTHISERKAFKKKYKKTMED